MKTIITALLLIIITGLTYSQMETAKRWTNTYNSGQRDVAVKSMCDSEGNLYVAGYRSVSGLTTDSTARMLLVKYNAEGGMEWQKVFQSRNGRRTLAFSMDIDDSNNVLLCGIADTSAYDLRRGLVVKYNSAGDTLWARYNGFYIYSWVYHDVKADVSGNVYLSYELIVHIPMPGRSCSMVKYNSGGGLEWTSQAVVNATNPLLEVNTFGSAFMGCVTHGAGSGDIKIVNIDVNGTQQWGVTYNSPNNGIDTLLGLGSDPVTGDLIAIGRAQLVFGSLMEVQTMKFGSALGQLMWVKRTNGTAANGVNTIDDFAVSPAGDVYICGRFDNNTTSTDGFFIKYNQGGNEVYRKIYSYNGGNTLEGITAVDVGSSNEPVISGYRASVKNSFIHRYSSSGGIVWKYDYNDSLNAFEEVPKKIVKGAGSKIYNVVNYFNASSNDINVSMWDNIPVNRLSLCRNFNTSTIAGSYIYDTVSVNTGMNKLVRIEVRIDSLVHSDPKDLVIKLKSPGGVIKDLFKNSGLMMPSTGMYGTVLTDTAAKTIDSGSVTYTGYFAPFEPLEVHNSYVPDGNWVLMVYNIANGDTGTVKKWCLNVIYEAPVGIQTINNEIPKNFNLSQNYPNPFNPVTNIKFSIPKSGNVSLKVYDILGRQVAELVNEFKPQGSYVVDFNATSLASGVYFYRIETADFTDVKKMLMVK
jgi:subtilisin-like proprotein convertase family protein